MKFYKQIWYWTLVIAGSFFSMALAGAVNPVNPTAISFVIIGSLFACVYAVGGWRLWRKGRPPRHFCGSCSDFINTTFYYPWPKCVRYPRIEPLSYGEPNCHSARRLKTQAVSERLHRAINSPFNLTRRRKDNYYRAYAKKGYGWILVNVALNLSLSLKMAEEWTFHNGEPCFILCGGKLVADTKHVKALIDKAQRDNDVLESSIDKFDERAMEQAWLHVLLLPVKNISKLAWKDGVMNAKVEYQESLEYLEDDVAFRL